MHVGANYRKGTEGYAPHAHIVEFGTEPRFHSSGKFVGQMPAYPMLRPAWNATKITLALDVAEVLKVEVEKSAQRLARKNSRKK